MENKVTVLTTVPAAPERLLPRELVDQHGVQAASDQELLQIILRTGTSKYSVAKLAGLLLQHYDNLAFLAQANLTQLQEFPGIGLTKAIELQAAFELGRRSLQQSQLRRGVVVSSGMIGQQLVERMQGTVQEELRVIYLDTKNQIIQERLIFTGSLNSSVAHPREIYHYAVLLSAARLIVVHNHPSGQVTPSQNDLVFSQRLVKCGEMMGIQCLDHLIIGSKQYLSLREAKFI
ncbi:RadC family protein [Lapidilactobacillus gannanensis]|jgi:DNA repair protein RadC|uniref:DNA repair protein RadC n=1 Tax=Lapidilactobacillus gannanensis TaxID=2486002 RepID=A0ABW4BSS5_9LACO|nr:DNA repair protein RadC [Lapidilactobacillus gannanensis]MCH4056774.1 DNA repair protein RadC [Lactobacillaceae bacterium]